jgi:hypothetical protein
VTDREIDNILKQSAQAPHDVEPELLDRLAASLGSTIVPVRPLPPVWLFAVGLVLIGVAAALAGAARLGFYGLLKLNAVERALIFPALAVCLWLSATAAVRARIPGSRRLAAPETLLALDSLALIAIFAILFHDYHVVHFVHTGLVCLAAGLLYAIPAALAGWLLLRRGFAVNAGAAGLAAGTLAGLAGVTMLELHCGNFQALHVMVWHSAVLPISGAAGALLAWVLRSRSGPGASEK